MAYLALAWVVGLVIALDSDGATRARLAQAFVPLTTDWNALLSAFVGTSRALGGGNPLVTGVGFAILVSDILALTAILYFYRNLRPRLAAHLARVTETAR